MKFFFLKRGRIIPPDLKLGGRSPSSHRLRRHCASGWGSNHTNPPVI